MTNSEFDNIKQRSRDRDSAHIGAGRISPSDLNAKNGFFDAHDLNHRENDNVKASEIFAVIKAASTDDLLMVGGQSIFFWQSMYAHKSSELSALAVTSEDIDFMQNRTASENLSKHFRVPIQTPSADDSTPSAARLNVPIGGRPIIIDFMRSVYGVDDGELRKRAVNFNIGETGKSPRISIMHPFHCLTSRLSNTNGPLGRTSEHARSQAEAACHILRLHIDALFDTEQASEGYKLLKALEYTVKNNHIGRRSHRIFGNTVNPAGILKSFEDDDRLHPAWREMSLLPILARLDEWTEKKIRRDRDNGLYFPGYQASETEEVPTLKM